MVRHPVLVTVFVLVAGVASAASPLTEVLDTRAVAMGGALRALATPLEAARINPAGLARTRGFFGGSSYLTRRHDAFDALSATLVDNISSPFGGAIQYVRFQGAQEREDLSLGLAAGRDGQWWGATLRYVHGRTRGADDWRDLLTGDLGALFERPSGLRFAVVGVNLFDTSNSFLERRISAGVAHADLWGWAVEGDLVRNLDEEFDRGLDAHLGAEYRLWGTVMLRIGQMWQGDTGKDYQSAGFGWQGDRVELGYAVQRTRQRSNELLHAFSLAGVF